MGPPRPSVGSVETTPRMDLLCLTVPMRAALTFLIIWQMSSMARSGDLPEAGEVFGFGDGGRTVFDDN